MVSLLHVIPPRGRGIVGSFGLLYAVQNQDKSKADHGYPAGIGVKNALIGVTNALGLLFTFLVPESKGKSLEEMLGENEERDDVVEMDPAGTGSNRTVPV